MCDFMLFQKYIAQMFGQTDNRQPQQTGNEVKCCAAQKHSMYILSSFDDTGNVWPLKPIPHNALSRSDYEAAELYKHSHHPPSPSYLPPQAFTCKCIPIDSTGTPRDQTSHKAITKQGRLADTYISLCVVYIIPSKILTQLVTCGMNNTAVQLASQPKPEGIVSGPTQSVWVSKHTDLTGPKGTLYLCSLMGQRPQPPGRKVEINQVEL